MGPTPYQYLPLWAKVAVERLDACAALRTESMLDELLEFIYASLEESWLDWTDVVTVAGKLAALGIQPPFSLLEGIAVDQSLNAGNRMVEHYTGRPAVVLHEG